MPSRSPLRRAALALAATAGLAVEEVRAELPPSREIIRSGDTLRGLGRLGGFSAYPTGIEASGAVRAVATLSDGSLAVVRAGGGAPQVLWRHGGSVDDSTPLPEYAIASPDGRYLFTMSAPFSPVAALVDLSTGSPRVVLRAGDPTSEGLVIASIDDARAVDDSGAVLLGVRLAGVIDGTSTSFAAVLRVEPSGARVIASAHPETPPALQIDRAFANGLTADGTAIVTGCQPGPPRRCGVFGGNGDTLVALIADGDPGPDGTPLGAVSALAVAADGDLLVRAHPPDRFDSSTILRVAEGRPLALPPATALGEGQRFEAYGGYLNSRGDVALAGPVTSDSSSSFGLLFYPAGGGSHLVADSFVGPMNEAGQVALLKQPLGAPPRLARWQDGRLATVLASASTLGGGVDFHAYGLSDPCFADDGRAAFFAGTADGARAWACADAAGNHLVASVGRPTPQTYAWNTFCAFAGDELVTLTDGRLSRLDGRVSSTVLDLNDELPDGSRIYDVYALTANDAGTILVYGYGADQPVVARQRRDGPLERVPIGGADDYIGAAGIAADDTVVAMLGLANGEAQLVAVRDSGTEVLSTPEFFFDGFPTDLIVNGMVAVLTVYGPGETPSRLILFDLASGTVRDVFERAEGEGNPYALALSPSGAVVFETRIGERFGTSKHWLWQDERVELLQEFEIRSDFAQPIALASTGGMLLSAPGGFSYSPVRLLATGPEATDACPGATTTTAGGSDDDGCAITDRPRAAWWPFVPALLLWMARRYRVTSASALTGLRPRVDRAHPGLRPGLKSRRPLRGLTNEEPRSSGSMRSTPVRSPEGAGGIQPRAQPWVRRSSRVAGAL